MYRDEPLSVTVSRAARILGVSTRKILKMIREGKLRTVKGFGSFKKVLVESLNEIIRERGEPMSPPTAIPAKTRRARTEAPNPAPPVQIVEVKVDPPPKPRQVDEEPVCLPMLPVDGNSAHLLRSLPGSDAVPRACSACGGMMDRRGSNFVCISCGNAINVYDQTLVR